MKNKKITFTQAELDTGNQIKKPCWLTDFDSPTRLESVPRFIYVVNECGKDIELNIMSKSELSEYNTSTGYFTGIVILNGTTFSSKDIFGIFGEREDSRRIDYVLIKKIEAGNTSANLTVYCVDYV